MNVTCFCSVIYPNNIVFFESYLISLTKQTDKNFTLLLFNDGIENLANYLTRYNFEYQIITVIGTASEIRTQMFNYLKQSSFEYVIFGDTDDYFPENRVAINKLLLKTYDVVANDLCLVTEQEELITDCYWRDRKELKNLIDLSSISEYNFLGLGNTAMRTESLPINVVFEESVIAVDWLFFSRILKNSVRVCFTSETFIYYRQHENNTIGRKALTLDKFKREFKIKLNHYTILAKEDEAFEKFAISYQSAALKVEALNLEELEDYYIKKEHPFWWEEIQLCKFN